MALALTAWLASVPWGGVVNHNGAPGSGKSWNLKRADEQLRNGAFKRRCVFDVYANRDRRLRELGKSHGEPWSGTYCTAEDLALYPEELLDDPHARIVVAPNTLDPQTLGEMFTVTARACWASGEIRLIAEEAAIYARAALAIILQITSGGRHSLMALDAVTQSLGRFPLDGRRHITHVVAYAQGEPSDLDDLRARCGRAFAARVQRLSPGDPPELWKLGDAMNESES
jgi:hypothetical protein